VPFSDNLELISFYETARAKGFLNNISSHAIHGCFSGEKKFQTWILYYNDQAVGSVAAHSFDEMGENAYRICARTCVFTDQIGTNTLRTRNQIITHQHVTAQFFIPTCIEWAGRNNDLYITSNNLSHGSQKLVHKIYFPAMEASGQVRLIGEKMYRGTVQSIWKLNVDRFYQELDNHGRWILQK